jgi:hypothetical protein
MGHAWHSRENRLDVKLFDISGHFGIGWSRLEAIGSIQYLGQYLHIPGSNQKRVRQTQTPMNRFVNGILSL